MTEIHKDTPANLFTCAVLAVKNTPAMIFEDGTRSNPPAPLLYSFTVYAAQLPPEEEEQERALKTMAGTEVLPYLPPGYAIALIATRPIPPKMVMTAAAQYCAETPLYGQPGKAGQPFFFEAGGENVFNTHRPGLDSQNRSPRYSFLCPYCGSAAIRFTGDIDLRTPDGWRATYSVESRGESYTPGAPDDSLSAPWQGRCGLSFQATCIRNHRFTVRFIEDATFNGPAIFLVFGYEEGAGVWINQARPGSGAYPVR